jgi:hypothetical protein
MAVFDWISSTKEARNNFKPSTLDAATNFMNSMEFSIVFPHDYSKSYR